MADLPPSSSTSGHRDGHAGTSPESPPESAGQASTQGSAVRGASVLIILQIASRAVTFIANQLLLRFLTAQLLGIATQLEVYYLSVLFFARESLRVAIQRQGGRHSTTNSQGEARDSQSVVNVGHLAVVLGVGVSVGLGGAYLHYVDPAAASTPYLEPALYIYGVASIVELLSEPAFVVLQHRLRFGPRAAAESIATFARCVLTFGVANWAWRTGVQVGMLPFAMGQLAYGAGLLAVYLWYGWSLASAEGFSLLPTRLTTAGNTERAQGAVGEYTLGYFYTPTLQLASSLVAQSVVKHILTQGDTFLVSVLSNAQSQGVYALANNYGSLLARLVFQPIEESSRNYFSKVLAAPSSPRESASIDADKSTKAALEKAKASLQGLLHFYTLLSTLIVTVGPYALPLLIQLILGSRSSETFEGAGPVLAQYCFYIPLLAINGISEAFVSSVATEPQVHRQSLWMGGFTLAFGLAGFVFLRVLGLGASGLVYANAINMLCRIVWSSQFISRYFTAKGSDFAWGGVMPKGMAAYVVGTAVLWQGLRMAGVSAGGMSSHVFKDLITVAVLAVPYAALVAFMERHYILECYRSIRGGRSTP